MTIGGDQDFRLLSVLRFYGSQVLDKEKAAEYCEQGKWPQRGPEWLICHEDSCLAAVPRVKELAGPAGGKYVFVKAFPSAPLSGMHWFLYRNQSP
jgi:hypothetical protein